MAEFKFEMGGTFQSLTKPELDESLRTAADIWKQRGLGVKWTLWTAPPGQLGGPSYVVPGPLAGWGWALKMISVQLSAAGSVTAYYGESANGRAIAGPGAGFPAAAGTLQIATFTSNIAILPPTQNLYIAATGANLSTLMVTAFQFPYERLADVL